MTPTGKKLALCIGGFVAAAVLACGALLVYLRFFWAPEFPLLDKLNAAAEVVASAELIALVPERDEPILAFGPPSDREPFQIPDRASLSTEICKLSPEANVLVLLPQGDIDRPLLELELVPLSSPPFPISCPTAARFYSVQQRSPSPATQ